MEFFDVVSKRYTHKERFLPTAVPIKDLERIANAGISAPTGNNSQCVNLIILPDRESMEPLCRVSQATGLMTAPSAIAVLTTLSVQSEKNFFEVEDYAAAAAQMMLAVTALGYVTVWLDSPFFEESKQKAALAALGAPESCRLRVVLPVGLPDGKGSRRVKLPYDQRVSYGIYGGRKWHAR